MGFSELILEMVRPKTIDKLEVYVPKEGANGEEVESFYTKLFSTSGFSTAKDVYFGCELMDYWKIASKLRCQHAGLSIDEPEKLMNTFKDILRKGLPNQHEKASIQLHGNLGFAQQSTEVFSNFVETVAEVSGIKIIKPDDLDSVEVEALKKLAFHATNRYTYENLHTLQISRPELKRIYRLEQTVTERSGEKFFTLNFNGNEYILMICVEDLRSELWPSVKVSLVFMPRTIP
ncbi:unnamed protein product, partial [Mesorhabditis belari]|uniref:Uncharacterized protein n=1 Tax=Mesorhabditis belari TaxID=2138241 RepID=A0AAF3ESG4_9BILA